MTTTYHILIAGLAQINSKNRCLQIWNIIAIFAEYKINYFSKLPKNKKFLLLTRVLLTMKAYVNFEGEKVLIL